MGVKFKNVINGRMENKETPYWPFLRFLATCCLDE